MRGSYTISDGMVETTVFRANLIELLRRELKRQGDEYGGGFQAYRDTSMAIAYDGEIRLDGLADAILFPNWVQK